MIGKPYSGKPNVRLCVQQMLVCSAGNSLAMAKVRSHVARMAGLRETDILKPIDKVIQGMTASYQAAAQANVQVAPKVRNPEGRALNRGAKAAWTTED
jgi:hypothetical protein